MRASSRLWAAVSSSSSNYLTPYAPTGLTGILTHPHPRPTLLYLYSSTLQKLSRLPRDSVYRQSTEALTRHRLSTIEKTIPAGFAEWQAHIANDVLPKLTKGEMKVLGDVKNMEVDGKPYLYQKYEKRQVDDRTEEWDGDVYLGDLGEGVRSPALRAKQEQRAERGRKMFEGGQGDVIHNEPALTRDQIGGMENEIGAGLIEEVIISAEREHGLVDIMLENKVWEELDEKPEPGQWDYFQRDTAVQSTQSP